MLDVLTIMVVDDSPVMRAILGVILDAGGFDVVFAENVDVGLDLVEMRRPDVVLTDYTMPGKTGRDLVVRLRETGFHNPIFVVSSETDPQIRAAMSCAGADRWLPKPVCAAALLEALATVAQAGTAPSEAPGSTAPARIEASR